MEESTGVDFVGAATAAAVSVDTVGVVVALWWCAAVAAVVPAAVVVASQLV
jgi:hypothetical protein